MIDEAIIQVVRTVLERCQVYHQRLADGLSQTHRPVPYMYMRAQVQCWREGS